MKYNFYFLLFILFSGIMYSENTFNPIECNDEYYSKVQEISSLGQGYDFFEDLYSSYCTATQTNQSAIDSLSELLNNLIKLEAIAKKEDRVFLFEYFLVYYPFILDEISTHQQLNRFNIINKYHQQILRMSQDLSVTNRYAESYYGSSVLVDF